MSVIKYFDTAHIIRFGMTDHDNGKSEVQFWRNGVHFRIEVHQAEVRETDFERQWIPLLNPEPISLYADRWSELCGLVISQCMGILQELAPNAPYWTTLYDYFHVASYNIGLYGTPGSNATPRLLQGPMSTCASEMQPAAWNTFTVPDDLPIFDSREVIPLDHQHDFRSPPLKVWLPDGTVAFFFPCKMSIRRQDGSRFVDSVNESHQSVASYLLLHSLQIPRNATHAHIPKVLGVLSDSGHPAIDIRGKEGEKYVAGILLEWIDGFRLGNLRQSPNRHIAASNESKHVKWREQLIGIIRELHRHGVSALGVDITPFDIIIDRNNGHAWLTGFINCEVSEGHSAADVNELEQKQIQLVFDQWLSAEVEVSASDPQEIRKGAISRWFAISGSQQ